MGWFIPALIGALAGAGGASLFGGKGKEAEIKKTSTLSPEQESIMKGLGEYLSANMGKGATPYTGEQVAPMGGVESQGMDLLQNYVQGGVGTTGTMGLDAYQKALKGLDPKEVYQNYMKYTAPSEASYLKNVSIPTFKESMVPGGTLRSTGTERGIGDIISRYGEGQLGRIGERITSEAAGARSMLPYLSQMTGIEGQVPQMEAAFQYGQLPRMIEQAELTAKM